MYLLFDIFSNNNYRYFLFALLNIQLEESTYGGSKLYAITGGSSLQVSLLLTITSASGSYQELGGVRFIPCVEPYIAPLHKNECLVQGNVFYLMRSTCIHRKGAGI